MFLISTQMSKSNDKIKVGAKVKVTTPNLQIPVNTITEVTKVSNNSFLTKAKSEYWLNFNEVEVLPLTKEELQNSLKEADDKIAAIEKEKEAISAKISWLDETGATEYDETEYKVYKTLQTVNSSSSELEKAKVIAALIKG